MKPYIMLGAIWKGKHAPGTPFPLRAVNAQR